MPARLHAFMQYADDYNEARVDRTVEDHMHRFRDWRLAALVAAVANVDTPNAGTQLASVGGRMSLRISCDAALRSAR
jgi:hypothetical protein